MIFLLISTTVPGAEPTIKSKYIHALGGESLQNLLDNRIDFKSLKINKDKFYTRIKTWNSEIQDESKLSPNQKIYIEIPFRAKLLIGNERVDKSIKRKIASNNNPQNFEINLNNIATKQRLNNWNISFIYQLMKASIREEVPNTNIVTKSDQDSPITLGIKFSKRLSDDYSFSTNFLLSKFDESISDQNESLTLPLEIGLNSYLTYHHESVPIQLYTGIDINHLTSYNTEELVANNSLETREHTLGFITLGIEKTFKLFDKVFESKFDYGQSFYTTETRQSKTSTKKYQGMRYGLSIGMRLTQNWAAHTIIKRYVLTGATNLTSYRYGLGLEYYF